MEDYLKLIKIDLDEIVVLLENPPDDGFNISDLLNTVGAFRSVRDEVAKLQDSFKQFDAQQRIAKWKSEQPED